MANVHTLTQSFNSGELSPMLGSRFQVEKVASGCRRLRNFLIQVHGPAFRRPGMEFVGQSGSSAVRSRLLPFTFSTTTGAQLEFTPGGLRVWSNGLLVPLLNPVPLPYSESECADVQIVQVNDVCYLVHPSHAPRKLSRIADNDWRISEPAWKWPAMGDPSALTSDQAPTPVVLLQSTTGQTELRFIAQARTTDIVATVTSPDLTAATKRIGVERTYDGTTWTTGSVQIPNSKTWTTAPPTTLSTRVISSTGANLRVIFTGPLSPGSAVNIQVSYPVSPPVPSESYTLNTGDILSINTVTVPPGEWQATLVCPSVPGASAVFVEKFNGSTWDVLHGFAIAPSATLTYRGDTLTASAQIRLRWTGTIMDSGGRATIEQLVFPPSLDVTIAASHTTGTSRLLTASAPIFLPSHANSYWQISHRRATNYVEIKAASAGVSPTAMAAATSAEIRVSGAWQVLTYGTWDTTLYLERKRGTTWETVRSWDSNNDRNVASDGSEEEVVDMRIRIDAGTATTATGAAVPRFVLEVTDSIASGLVKIKAVGPLSSNGKSTTATVDIIHALQSTAATPLWEEGAWSDVRGYPRSVAIHGERLWFGGTAAEPMRVWGSVVADYEDFRRSSFDDASVSFTPAASSSNPIQWMLSRDRELIIGTAGDEWTISTDQGPITPVNVNVQRRSGYGSEYIQARLLGEVVVWVQRGGRKLRQVSPRSEQEPWVANDLTVLAEHLAKPGIVQIAVQTAPFTILWAVTATGGLLGMTFEQEQNVFGWHRHDTDGLVESVSVIRAEDVDEVWLVVKRGASSRFVERLDMRAMLGQFDQGDSLIYLDAAKRYELSEPAATVDGLDHLEGRTVGVVGDGAEQQNQVVTDGEITLEAEASTVVVGLPFVSELQPMRMDLPLRDGTAQGREFKVSRVYLTLDNSLGGEIADYPDRARWEPIDYRRASTPMDEAPSLFTGEFETAIDGNARAGVDVIVRQRSPFPLNVGSIVVSLDMYGD